MSKDRPDKQKNIEDVLLSIDSLLDTATDIEPGDSCEIQDAQGTKSTSTKKADKSTAKSEQSFISRSRLNAPAKTQQKKPVRASKSSAPFNRAISSAKSEEVHNATTNKTVQTENPSTQTATTKHAPSDEIENSTLRDAETISEAGQSNSDEKNRPEDVSQGKEVDDGSSNSLVFTTVDDDLHDVMRELPLLDDIVTAEDLALIGSGKEPPKKILTEAFRRQSLADKLIEILENQLSDYNISKLEYKYLHELFDELLDSEQKKK